MNYLLLLTATLGISAQDVLRKYHDRRGTPPPDATMAFNLVISVTVLLFFTAAAGFCIRPHIPTLPYALGFAAAYVLTMGFSMLAVSAGPLSLTSLVMACSMLLPAVHGSLFLKERFGTANLIGLALLLCALCLLCLDRKERIEKRWHGYAAVMFFANGLCSIIQKIHQLEFAGSYKSEFMVFAIAACGLLEIARQVSPEESRLYEEGAVRLLQGLEEYCDFGLQEQSVLQMGSEAYNMKIHIPIIYGDYYLMEALAIICNTDAKRFW